MKPVVWCFFIAACAREPWQRAVPAALVPALELGVAYRVQQLATRERSDVGLFARLRWSARSVAAAVPSQIEQTPALWFAPCALEDVTCLSELAEAEPEVAAALRERP
ncbi:MAG TPA: hypothetical protein VI299_00465 [Polyangiales bacterium]